MHVVKIDYNWYDHRNHQKRDTSPVKTTTIPAKNFYNQIRKKCLSQNFSYIRILTGTCFFNNVERKDLCNN